MRFRAIYKFLTVFLLAAGIFISCNQKDNNKIEKCLDVHASAYNNLSWQTKTVNPSIAAWGDTLKEGMKVIAVSRDLLDSGLQHNTAVYIPRLQDTFYVKDKMHWRWKNKIDIFMGKDIEKAREWGKQKLAIKWLEAKPEKLTEGE